MPAISPPPPTATKIAWSGRVLAQDLDADRALARDHVGIVVGVDEAEAAAALSLRACA